MSVPIPHTTASPANADVLKDAARMPTRARFHYLLRHTKALVQLHGPYTTHNGTTVFARAVHPHTKLCNHSSKCLATSLACAQDCIGSAQLPGPAKEDLHIFKHLWDTTLELLEQILTSGDLDHESFGWGVFGLCAGYMYPPSEASVEIFEDRKYRLHEALLATPNMDSPRRRKELVVEGEGTVEILAKAHRQVHICANLVLQRFRQESWHRIRWWHGIQVAEIWIERLRLADEMKGAEEEHDLEKTQEQCTNGNVTNGV